MNKETKIMTYALPIRVVSLLTAIFLAMPVAAQDDAHEGGLTGTGIYGVVAAGEAFSVNGQTISTANATMIADPIGGASTQDIEAGNIVALQVSASDANLNAVSIQRVFAMIGPVQEVAGNKLIIMGTDVAVSNMDIAGLRPGDWVAVSGFWRENDLAATHIDDVAPQELAHMTGTYFSPVDDGMPQFGASQLIGLVTDDLAQGAVVSVMGQPTDTGIEIVAQNVGIFDQNVGYVLAQGYLSRPKAGGFYTLIGSGLIAFNDDPDMPLPVNAVVVCGVDGRLIGTDGAGISEVDRAQLGLWAASDLISYQNATICVFCVSYA